MSEILFKYNINSSNEEFILVKNPVLLARESNTYMQTMPKRGKRIFFEKWKMEFFPKIQNGIFPNNKKMKFFRKIENEIFPKNRK